LLVGCTPIIASGVQSPNQFQLFWSTDGPVFFNPTPPDSFGAVMFATFTVSYQSA